MPHGWGRCWRGGLFGWPELLIRLSNTMTMIVGWEVGGGKETGCFFPPPLPDRGFGVCTTGSMGVWAFNVGILSQMPGLDSRCSLRSRASCLPPPPHVHPPLGTTVPPHPGENRCQVTPPPPGGG